MLKRFRKNTLTGSIACSDNPIASLVPDSITAAFDAFAFSFCVVARAILRQKWVNSPAYGYAVEKAKPPKTCQRTI